MKIDRALVEHLARLSRLELTESEKVEYERELTDILGLMERLDRIDVSHVPETARVLDVQNVFRADAPTPSWEPDRLLENAPERVGDAFAVPRVLGS